MRRRDFVLAGGGLVLAPAWAVAQSGQTPTEVIEALQAAAKAAVDELLAGAEARRGRVLVDLPPLVENGNVVPLTIEVESPMTTADHVRAIHVFAEKNPQPRVAVFRFGPRAGRARVSTRIRLNNSQTLLAIGEMSDGSFWSGTADVIVTLAACTDVL